MSDTVEVRIEVRWRGKEGMRIHRVIPSSITVQAATLEEAVVIGAAREAQTIFRALLREVKA